MEIIFVKDNQITEEPGQYFWGGNIFVEDMIEAFKFRLDFCKASEGVLIFDIDELFKENAFITLQRFSADDEKKTREELLNSIKEAQ